ncbi:Heterokaryon incompatibility protein 6, OR allele 5 [Colletotrichum chlorophyti]|uniref:Heterokaryon incompatibility protein 6, OR allele 5 n=1 Tax=Colletotrichum chlorophyti TaxID=708187 RepID=A0A1Q8RS22_9PEZI|nr:Heterokaryon incompatibility protein 6, OR allele 5 [Colletotrichum chlorophyti]
MSSVLSPPEPPKGRAHFSYDNDIARLPSASTHIRLLELYPSRAGAGAASASASAPGDGGESNDSFAHYSSPLVCSISVTPIARPRQFNALSYTWGPAEKSHVVEIAGAHLGITSSLDTVLRYLRRRDDSVTLWVDQICINQEDTAEKSDQVPLMTQIYSEAHQVLVWLGPAGDDSDALMDCFHDIGQGARELGIESYLNKERLPLMHSLLGNRDPTDPLTMQFQALKAKAKPRFSALLEAMIAWNERPWFGRVWIIQEQALCPDTKFMCGYKTLDLDLLPLAMLIFDGCMGQNAVDEPSKQNHQLLLKAQDRRFGPLMAVRRRRRNFVKGEGPGDDMYHALKKAYVDGDAKATLPRDRIYGLLSVAVDSERLGLTPSYTRPDCQPTFVEAARALVQAGRVEMLSFSQFPKDVDGLPSWVPDWRSTLARSYLAIFEDADNMLVCAGGQSAVEVVPTDDPGVLGIFGHVVDAIEVTGDVWEWEAGHDARSRLLQQVKSFCERSSQNDCGIYQDGVRRTEAAWRVPVGDLSWTKEASYHRAGPGDKGDYEDCINVLATLAEFESLGPEQRRQRMDDFFRQLPGQSRYSENMDKMTGKRPYMTRQGYVGMAPAGARSGDVVVILLGSRIPYVLRPSGNGMRWCFVGEAYCDGAMDGETLTRRPREAFFIS